MTATEIQNAAIGSSEKMLAWMIAEQKGRDEIPVNEIIRKGAAKVYTLRISKRLFSLESIFFKLSTIDEELDTGAIKVLEYDRDQSLLIVRPSEKYQAIFADLKPKQLKVITDLRFLVERTRDWYITNGAKLALPTTSSTITQPFDADAECFSDAMPNADQQLAIKDIFEQPFTYIWGAPGTGKTQFVLAYAALRYLRRGKRIAIIAPTNLSLEQVLRGIMEMTEKEGVPKERILRLGVPTKAFAKEHGEVCEVVGIQRKLTEIENQLRILDKIGGIQLEEDELQKLEEAIQRFPEQLDLLTIDLVKKTGIADAAEKVRQKLEIDISYPEKEKASLAKKETNLEQKLESSWTRFKRWLGVSSTSIEALLRTVRNRIETLEKKQMLDREELVKAKQKEVLANKAKAASLVQHNGLVDGIVSKVGAYDWLKGMLGTDPAETLSVEPEPILNAIQQKVEKLEEEAALFAAYQHFSPEEIAVKRLYYEAEKAKLQEHSTAERIEKANIIAATLDTYLGRYKDEKLPIDHFFLDEAGYANEIKALTLFNHGVPVTFLGDHMQLPPVCEVNNQTIEKIEGFEDVYLWAESALWLGLLFGEHSSVACAQFYLKNTHPQDMRLSRSRLTQTHRFGPALAAVLSRFVYENQFSSSPHRTGDDTIIRVKSAKKRDGDQHNTSSGETLTIAALVPTLNDYVILAPYRNQVNKLKAAIPQARNDERILTIHKSQGREWDTVVLSVTDQDARVFTDTESNWASGLNVINTAVSRAKKELIIVCNHDVWQNKNGQLIQGLIEVAEID